MSHGGFESYDQSYDPNQGYNPNQVCYTKSYLSQVLSNVLVERTDINNRFDSELQFKSICFLEIFER